MNYLIANPDLVCRQEDDIGLLFNPDTGEIKVLNELGLAIWTVLDGKHSNEEIISQIQKDYSDVLPETIKSDFDKFIADLEKLKFIKESPD